jgi:hypothetical protein
MGWAGHAACMCGKKRCIQGFGAEDMTDRNHLEDLGVDGRIPSFFK